MKLRQYLDERNIHLDLEFDGKQGFFHDALSQLCEMGLVSSPERVQKDLELREAIMSTGVGLGVAIPHAQSEGVERIHVSLWRPGKGLDFDAVDGQSVDLIFMILGPKSDGSEHVKILAHISRMLHGEDFRDRLRAAGSASEIHQVLHQFDES